MAAAEGNSPPLKKFTGYNDVAPAVWLEKYAIFANLKGWNPNKHLIMLDFIWATAHIQRVPINIVHGEINDFLKGRSDYRIIFYSSFKPMVLFIIGEKMKEIHRRRPEISLIWYDYVLFGLHNVISTHKHDKVSYLLCWNVLRIVQCLNYCMAHTGRLDEVFTEHFWVQSNITWNP